jgi:hypothetical protein
MDPADDQVVASLCWIAYNFRCQFAALAVGLSWVQLSLVTPDWGKFLGALVVAAGLE